MRSSSWSDGYGTTVEVIHGLPEVCPDGEVRTWCEVIVSEDDYPADALTLRLTPSDLDDLADMLRDVAARYAEVTP